MNKIFIGIIIILFINTSFVSSGYSEEINKRDTYVNNDNELQKDVSVTCYTFGFPGKPTQEITMSLSEAEFLYDKIKDLQLENARDPLSDKTQQLQHEIIALADEHNLLPAGLSADKLKSRFNPSWTSQNRRLRSISPLQSKASEFLCTFISTGSGASLPVIVLPRFIPILLTPLPRIFMLWRAQDAMTSCGGLRSGTGFIAYGQQNGLALGFWGLGFTFSLPPLMGVYGLAGYALFATVDAEEIEYYPPNRAPVISDENPPDGVWDVSISLSELSFRINDADGDLMGYTVTTEPNIGSGSGNLKPNGVYSIPVNGLEHDKIYRWIVEVSDGKDTVKEQFSFFTEAIPPFDPFGEGWQYRKQITIDHTQVAGDLYNFPLLVSTIDIDLRDKAQEDGDDILFMDGAGIASKLPYEIERYDDSTGELIAWVDLPSLSSTVDTTFYLYYGNSNTGSLQFPEKVWSLQFKAVWHLHESPTEPILDSTHNDNDGMAQGSMTQSDLVDGKMGKCLDFDGYDGYLSFSDFTSSHNCGTVTAWVQTTSSERMVVWGEGKTSSHKPYIAFGKRYDGEIWYGRDIYGMDSNYQGRKEVGMNDGRWHHVVWLSKGSGNGNGFYFDGEEIQLLWLDNRNPGGIWFDDQSADTESISILDRATKDYPWRGLLDEIHISDFPLSQSWISTEFNNQNNSIDFLSFGPEESEP